MNKQLQLLRQLQSLDDQIVRMEEVIQRIPKEIEDHYSLCQMAKDDLDQFRGEIKTAQLSRKEKETEVEAQKEQMRKEHGKQHAVKTNKEYSALLEEIENIKKQISRLDDEQIELMEQIEDKTKEVRRKEENLKKEEEKFAHFKAEKEQDLARVKSNRDRKREERKQVTSELEAPFLENYKKVYQQRDHLAVTRYTNGICQGCNFTLPPQLGVEIKQDEKVIACPFCNRYLYFENNRKEEEPG